VAALTVSVEHPHSKLIAARAREVLQPMGIKRQGRSRSWYDDQGWWAGLIEFQPSNWRRGSYLNVGVQWLWDVHWRSLSAFMYPDSYHVRVPIPGEGDLIKYESDEQFAPLVDKMVDMAAKRARYFRKLFPNVEAAAKVLAKCEEIARKIDAGIALGLIGDREGARQRFDQFLDYDQSDEAQEYRGDWQDERAERVRGLRASVNNTKRFRAMIADDIRSVRTAAKLEPNELLPF
jgi:hypothetical protein